MLNKNVVVRIFSTFITPIIFLYGLYIQFHGEISPGGGFQAGVICACAVVLYSLVFDSDKISNMKLLYFAAAGVFLYFIVGILCIFFGGNFLQYDYFFGQHAGIFIVELGIGIAIFSGMLIIYTSFRKMGD